MQIVDANGNPVATYSYDPYGNVITAAGNLASVNPLRYRGYYYDTETGLYYVSSRYYDPEIGRFVNADALVSTGQGILGHNMFAYCGNNPVNYFDPRGTERISFYNSQFDGHSGSDGGGGIGVVSPRDVAQLLQAGKDAFVKLSSLLALVQTSLTFDPDNGEYYVYALVDAEEYIQYVGRTKNPRARREAHRKNPSRRDLSFEIVGSNLDYLQARGLEQALMLYCHTIDKSNPTNNQINGISPNNVRVDKYLDAAERALGYSWNQFSNEMLCWMGQ